MSNDIKRLDGILQKLNWVEFKIDEMLRNQHVFMDALDTMAKASKIDLQEHVKKINEPVTIIKKGFKSKKQG